MNKYNRTVTVSGCSYRMSSTMADIFLAHVSDIAARNETELVPLLHEGGVEMLLITPTSTVDVARVTHEVSVPA